MTIYAIQVTNTPLLVSLKRRVHSNIAIKKRTQSEMFYELMIRNYI